MKLMSEMGNFRHLISTTNFPGELMLSAPSSHICYQVNIWVELVNNSVVSISTKESRYMFSKIHYISQCAEEKSNESVGDMDGTFTGW